MLLTPQQFAEWQGQSVRTIQRRMLSGELEFTRPFVGRRAKYIDSDQLCPEPIPEPMPRVSVPRGRVPNARELSYMPVVALAVSLVWFLNRKLQNALDRRRSEKVQSARDGSARIKTDTVAPILDRQGCDIAQIVADLA